MKKIITVVTLVFGLNFADQAGAESNGLNGMLLGAGSGALIGQAAGRNTQSTLVGTAVGGAMIGYALDNNGAGRVDARPRYGYQPREIVVRPENQQTCREMEMLATIDGRAEKVYGQACWQDGEWVRIEDERPQPVAYRPVLIREEYYWLGDRGHYRQGRHRDENRRWAGHDHNDHGPQVIYRVER